MSFRSLVAMAYHFGVELNPLTLTAEERDELAHFIAVHKRLRPILHAPGAQFGASRLMAVILGRQQSGQDCSFCDPGSVDDQ